MSKLHGMESDKARRIKKRGHKKESIYATLIGGTIVPGVKKADVIDCNGKYHSIKGGSEIKGGDGLKGKWQIFLYKLERFETDVLFGGREICIDILKCYPNNYNDYLLYKSDIKNKIKEHMMKLYSYLCDPTNRYNFFNHSFFDDRVDYFVVYHNDVFRVFERKEFIGILIDSLSVCLNSTYQKVVFKYNNRIVLEIEVRTTNDGKYPALFFNALKHKVCNIVLERKMVYGILHSNVYVYGNAIQTINLGEIKLVSNYD